ETQRLMAEPVPGIKAEPDDSNARYFHVVIAGPQDSPFEGGTFKLELFLPEEYPMAAPKVRFMTKIYHPNVDKLGRICLDILKGSRFIAFKVPLKGATNQRVTETQKFTPKDLVTAIRNQNEELGLIVDLTNTERYYTTKDFYTM
ncbi:hypothetical protein AB205_0060440, partial [Aquarana catesbeiana]